MAYIRGSQMLQKRPYMTLIFDYPQLSLSARKRDRFLRYQDIKIITKLLIISTFLNLRLENEA